MQCWHNPGMRLIYNTLWRASHTLALNLFRRCECSKRRTRSLALQSTTVEVQPQRGGSRWPGPRRDDHAASTTRLPPSQSQQCCAVLSHGACENTRQAERQPKQEKQPCPLPGFGQVGLNSSSSFLPESALRPPQAAWAAVHLMHALT